MSWEATAYVKSLNACPDGVALERGQKLLLFVLADYHNTAYRAAWPSIPTLARESLTSESTVKRDLAALERHCVVEKRRPENQGRHQNCSYVFLALDDPKRLAELVSNLAKGVHGEPLFSAAERGSEGVQIEDKRGSFEGQKGFKSGIAIRKEPQEPKENLERSRARARSPLLSQSERDSLDLKRWQAEMKLRAPQAGQYVEHPDEEWRARARSSAYIAGISPARLVELLRQHFPADETIDELYPGRASV